MERIDEAFKQVPRARFLPPAVQDIEQIDAPLSIGYGQTNSQPSTVRMMLEWLDPQPGERILDVGSGSGWTTALLAYLIGPKGMVYAVEKVPELVKFGTENAKRHGTKNAQFFEAGDAFGLSEFAPFDRILVSAAASQLPSDLLKQLVNKGRLVIPIDNSIFVIDKTGKESFESKEYPGFVFVPLV